MIKYAFNIKSINKPLHRFDFAYHSRGMIGLYPSANSHSYFSIKDIRSDFDWVMSYNSREILNDLELLKITDSGHIIKLKPSRLKQII